MPVFLAVFVGAVLTASGAVLLIPLPEVGLPLLLGGLRLLGRRFAWARKLNHQMDRTAATLVARYRHLPGLERGLVLLLLAGLGVLVGYIALRELT